MTARKSARYRRRKASRLRARIRDLEAQLATLTAERDALRTRLGNVQSACVSALSRPWVRTAGVKPEDFQAIIEAMQAPPTSAPGDAATPEPGCGCGDGSDGPCDLHEPGCDDCGGPLSECGGKHPPDATKAPVVAADGTVMPEGWIDVSWKHYPRCAHFEHKTARASQANVPAYVFQHGRRVGFSADGPGGQHADVATAREAALFAVPEGGA